MNLSELLTERLISADLKADGKLAVLDELAHLISRTHAGINPTVVARALLDQLVHNLRGLRVERIQTEVEWDQWDLLGFLRDVGFRPAPRIALEYPLAP